MVYDAVEWKYRTLFIVHIMTNLWWPAIFLFCAFNKVTPANIEYLRIQPLLKHDIYDMKFFAAHGGRVKIHIYPNLLSLILFLCGRIISHWGQHSWSRQVFHCRGGSTDVVGGLHQAVSSFFLQRLKAIPSTLGWQGCKKVVVCKSCHTYIE